MIRAFAAVAVPLIGVLGSTLPQPAGPRAPEPPARPNVVLITIDDIGVEKIGAFGEGPPGVAAPCTPRIDQLAAGGLLFRNAWTNPYCSPSRAQLLTGRHGFRTGVGRSISSTKRPLDVGLSVDLEVTLPEALVGYDHAAVGKWHLAAPLETGSNGQGLQHPLRTGFNDFAGSMFNLDEPAIPCGSSCVPQSCPWPRGYSNWVKTSDVLGNGQLEQACTNTYATSDTADEAIARARSMQWPWFLYVSFNAAHSPIHDPPLCHTTGTCASQYCPSSTYEPKARRFNAMVEALDAEIGRMLDEIFDVDPSVYVFLIADNGTAYAGAQGAPGQCFSPGKSKGTLYEGGVNVPLIVRGPGTTTGESSALVCSTDLFATICRLAGVPCTAQDSVSLLPYLYGDESPRRATVYAEVFGPNQVTPDHPSTPHFAPESHARAIRNARYKLIRTTNSSGLVDEQLYDLRWDPCELLDLCPGPGPCDGVALPAEPRAGYARLRSGLVDLGVY